MAGNLSSGRGDRTGPNKNNLMCSVKCDSEVSQTKIFESCTPFLDKLGVISIPKLCNIFGSLKEQISAIKVFVIIKDLRTQLISDSLSIEQLLG